MLSEEKAKPAEMVRFESALRRVLQVSKEDLKRLSTSQEAKNAVKQKRGPRPKRVAPISR